MTDEERADAVLRRLHDVTFAACDEGVRVCVFACVPTSDGGALRMVALPVCVLPGAAELIEDELMSALAQFDPDAPRAS